MDPSGRVLQALQLDVYLLMLHLLHLKSPDNLL
jgi:hypothetical protein